MATSRLPVSFTLSVQLMIWGIWASLPSGITMLSDVIASAVLHWAAGLWNLTEECSQSYPIGPSTTSQPLAFYRLQK